MALNFQEKFKFHTSVLMQHYKNIRTGKKRGLRAFGGLQANLSEVEKANFTLSNIQNPEKKA